MQGRVCLRVSVSVCVCFPKYINTTCSVCTWIFKSEFYKTQRVKLSPANKNPFKMLILTWQYLLPEVRWLLRTHWELELLWCIRFSDTMPGTQLALCSHLNFTFVINSLSSFLSFNFSWTWNLVTSILTWILRLLISVHHSLLETYTSFIFCYPCISCYSSCFCCSKCFKAWDFSASNPCDLFSFSICFHFYSASFWLQRPFLSYYSYYSLNLFLVQQTNLYF